MPRRRKLTLLALPLAAAAIAACGKEGIDLAKSDPDYKGAQLFAQRCSGCHTFARAGTQGGAKGINYRERSDGPNFDVRKETVDGVLYAIRNGGFSGAIMPQNIVVGDDARAVARFVAKYAGRKGKSPPGPANKPPPGF